MKRFIALLLIFILGLFFFQYIKKVDFGKEKWGVSKKYVEEGIEDNRGSNIVTSIVVNYRGFDTVGEVTVLFLAVTGLSFFLSSFKKKEKKRLVKPSFIVSSSSTILYPFILLFGVYIFIHGHLTPGGGFQGGSVIVTGVLLMMLAQYGYDPEHKVLSIFESLSGIGFIVAGFLGFFIAGSFLANKVLPLGEWNRLFSAGIIPIIYVFIGIKVGSELTGLVSYMMGKGGRR